MLGWFAADRRRKRSAERLYGQIVAHARHEAFYAEMSVADSLQGRFEILVLHLYLVMERLAALGTDGQRLSRAVGEQFVVDMDDNMREMGVGDLAVPKRVKKAAAALYERLEDYREAVPKGERVLTGVLERAIPVREGLALDAPRLVRYTDAMAADLARLPLEAFEAGDIRFLQP